MFAFKMVGFQDFLPGKTVIIPTATPNDVGSFPVTVTLNLYSPLAMSAVNVLVLAVVACLTISLKNLMTLPFYVN